MKKKSKSKKYLIDGANSINGEKHALIGAINGDINHKPVAKIEDANVLKEIELVRLHANHLTNDASTF